MGETPMLRMSTDVLDSSDAARTAKPLRHVRNFDIDGPITVERGGVLPAIRVAYETYGTLNAARDNAVLVCHALSGDSHVARHDDADDPGWWDLVVGPGKAIDTNRYFVICPNVLGGCRGSTGPNSINPATGKPYGSAFPLITVGDIVDTQRRLIDHLGVDRLRCVIGGSLGGHMALTWAAKLGERVASVIPIATSPRLTSQSLAFDIVARNAIMQDPAYHGGAYYDCADRPDTGLAIARMLGHITYLSREGMMQKFDANRLAGRDISTGFETRFNVGSYLAYQGDRFVERFDANSYVTLTMAMDLFDLGGTTAEIAQTLRDAACRWMLISFSSDWLFPPFQSRQIADALLSIGKRVSYCEVKSDCGHDAFLLENDLPTYGAMIRAMLADDAHASTANSHAEVDAPTSIFHGHRIDYDRIVDLIPHGASVLDLGCGSGGLLSRLRLGGHSKLLGIELDEQQLVATLERGHDVIQSDLNQGLGALSDGQFDVVVLSQTLQAVTRVDRVLAEMLRVGRRCIVSFPNIAFKPLRERLANDGRAPRGTALQGMSWHDTPNLRFLSIADFEDFCRAKGITCEKMIALDSASGKEVNVDPNLHADIAVFVIHR